MQHDYNIIKEKWSNELFRYAVKLSDILRNTYTNIEFRKWLHEHQYTNIDEIMNTNPDSIDNIDNKRLLVTDTSTSIYWLAKFKDENMQRVQLHKPKPPHLQKCFNGYYNLIIHLTELRQLFLFNNENINYYTIQLHFNGISNENPILYSKKSGNIYSSERVMSTNGPISISEKV